MTSKAKKRNWPISIGVTFVEIVLGSAFVLGTGTYFSVEGKTAVLLLSVLTGIFFDSKAVSLLKRPSQMISLLGASLVSAFCLVGNPLLVYPIAKAVSLRDFLLFILSVIWCAPIVLWLFSCIPHFSHYCMRKAGSSEKESVWPFFLVLVCSWMVYAAAFYPGISSADTLYIVSAALGSANIVNWHSPLLILIYRLLLTIWDNPMSVLIAQIFLLAYANAKMLLLFQKAGIKRNVCLVIAVLIGGGVNLALHAVTLWKDIPYTAVVLLAGTWFAEYYLFAGREKFTLIKYFELSLYLAFAVCFKTNGIVFALLILGAIVFLSHFGKKEIIAAVLFILQLVIVTGPIYSALHVVPTNPGGQFIGLGNDIRAVGVYDEHLPTISQDVFLQEGGAESFNPYCAGGSNTLEYVGYFYAPSMTYFIKAYVRTFFAHPIIMMHAVLCRTDCMWNIRAGIDGSVINAGQIQECLSASFNIQPADNILTHLLTSAVNNSLTGASAVILWRMGIWFVFAILMAGMLIFYKKQRYCLLLLPAMGQMLGLALSCGWMSYRYYLGYLELLFLFIGCAIAALAVNENSNE